MTFEVDARLSKLMLGKAITSALLSLIIAVSASACVVGSGAQAADFCGRFHSHHCARKRLGPAVASAPKCTGALQAPPGVCVLRGMLQFHPITFEGFAISTPLLLVAGHVPATFDSRVVVSSVGPPETDRGPPRFQETNL
jgi:hypothetical protein